MRNGPRTLAGALVALGTGIAACSGGGSGAPVDPGMNGNMGASPTPTVEVTPDASGQPGGTEDPLAIAAQAALSGVTAVATWGEGLGLACADGGLYRLEPGEPWMPRGDRLELCPANLADALGDPDCTPLFQAGLPRCESILVDGDMLFVGGQGERDGWLLRFDIEGGALRYQSHLRLGPGGAAGLARSGDRLFVAARDEGLYVIGLGNDGGMRRGTPLELAGRILDVDADETFAYAADLSGAVHLLSLADEAPRLERSLSSSGGPRAVVRVDDGLLVAAGGAGVELFGANGATLPDSPTTHVDTPGPALDIAVDGETVYVAAWDDLRVLSLTGGTLMPQAKEVIDVTAGERARVLHVATALEGAWVGLDENIARVDYIAGVVAPDLTASPREVVFFDVSTGDEDGALVLLFNDGGAPLTLGAPSVQGSPDFSIIEAPSSIEPGEAGTLELRFRASSEAPQQAMLTIPSDDPDEPEVTVGLRANPQGTLVGETVPDYTFVDIDGDRTWSLRELAAEGHVVALAYFATF